MKRFPFFRNFSAIVFVLIATIITTTTLNSCKKNDNQSDLPPEVEEVTSEGSELETPKTAVIGAAGGKLVSRDGNLEISIPQGALKNNTTFSVAAITNTSSAGIGLNYRITPHITFEKPVTLTFSFAGKVDSIASVAALGIGYRDEKGVWQVKTRTKLDQSKKTISVPTDHFSDWAALELVKLSPRYSIIDPGGSVRITAYTCVALKKIFDLDKVFDPNGPDESLPLVWPYPLPAKYIVDMYVLGKENENGIGTLTPDGPSSAVYKSTLEWNPPLNPVTIAFPLTTNRTTMILTAKVEVRHIELGVRIQIDGKTFSYEGEATYNNAGQCDIEFFDKKLNKYVGSLHWEGGTGEFGWTDKTDFWVEPEGYNPKRVFQHLYDDGRKYSAGTIKPFLIGPVGDMIVGEFKISQAGATNTQSGNGEYLGASEIIGEFKVKRLP
ncbi:MAG: hypothetical protein J7578_19685 [Chitinophagaceae bacterium]|nr:hypothetical protein [Chitinophagaceae bacterium]